MKVWVTTDGSSENSYDNLTAHVHYTKDFGVKCLKEALEKCIEDAGEDSLSVEALYFDDNEYVNNHNDACTATYSEIKQKLDAYLAQDLETYRIEFDDGMYFNKIEVKLVEVLGEAPKPEDITCYKCETINEGTRHVCKECATIIT